MNETDLSVLLRLGVAILLTGALGLERETAGKAAGIRTHMLVGIGSVLFVALGEIIVMRFADFPARMQFDPLRIVEAVVTGISFLGAGTIFFAREGRHVQGLTTAASIWTTAAVGMLVGLERYALAAVATAAVFLVLRLVGYLEIRKTSDEKSDAKAESVSGDVDH